MGEEVKLEIIQQTQKILGKYVKKPQLTEKLLKKPPFRFLHDVIRVVIQETGFLKGLYSAQELVSDNVKEREKKIAFLNKLIDATKTISGIELSVKSSKIIAGLEPTQTNLLLQAIGKAIDKKLDSTQYVQRFKKLENGKSDDVHKKAKEMSVTKSRQRSKETTKDKLKDEGNNKNLISPNTRKVNKEQRKSSEKVKKDHVVQKREEVPEKDTNAINKNDDETLKKSENESEESIEKLEEKTEMKTESIVENVPQNGFSEIKSPLQRPKSAKPKSANLKLKDKLEKEEEEKEIPSTTLRPPSVRPSSARPGAPRLRPESALPLKEPVTMGKINVIVENFDKMDDEEEETVIIESGLPEEVEEEATPQTNLNIPLEKGQLVEEILKQMGDEDVTGDKNTINSEWEINNFKNKDMANEIEQLRNSIQMLTRIANPFGKLISYLHEDVEAMYNELNMWKDMKRQTLAEIKKQETVIEELCSPFHDQLKNLDDAIEKQEEEILVMRAKLLKNQAHIRQTISQFV